MRVGTKLAAYGVVLAVAFGAGAIVGAAFASLDGVIQGPGGPNEDPTGGFRFSGWLPPVGDDAIDDKIGELFGLSQWQVRNLRYRLGIKKDRGGNVHLEPIRLRGADVADGVEALESGDGRPRLALTLEGEFSGATLASYLEGITGFVRAAGSRPFRVRCFVCEAEADEPGPSGR